ncbi:hypothetical protein ACIGCK_05230 [Microbacterium sp. NPDC078428]|uniref:hypothetical protein n=1 Tax=Microbacterium sp. NPDC078428 TaxID=3364190 RepID=UPI0037CC9647
MPAQHERANAVGLTINPEARVHAERRGAGVLEARAGEPLDVEVDVRNEGYVTSAVIAAVIAPAHGVQLTWSSDGLGGSLTETRTVRLIVEREGLVDIALSFRMPFEPPDLGGRDRVDLLVRVSG